MHNCRSWLHPSRKVPLLLAKRCKVGVSSQSVDEISLKNARPFQDIPGPKSLPLIGVIYKYLPGGEFYKMRLNNYELFQYKFAKYGSIFREQPRPGYCYVALRDPAHFREVFRQTGKAPDRNLDRFEFALKQRRKRRKPKGIFFENGEEWYRLRKQLQKEMMRPASISAYLPAQERVADDFMRRLGKLRNENGEVPNLLHELYKWAMESVGVICFDARLGAVDPDMETSEIADRFVKATSDSFQALSNLVFDNFRLYRFYETPDFKKYDQSEEVIWEIGAKYLGETLTRAKEGKEGLVKNKDNLTLTLLSKPDLSHEEAISFSLGLFAGGVDTTAHSLSFNLVHLTAHPEVQERLRAEVMRVVPPGKTLTEKEVEQLKYLKAVVKETSRLMPTTNASSRTFKYDIAVGGYRIPAGCDVVMFNSITAQSPEYVENPHVYQPERWLRDSRTNPIQPEVVLPFGFGPRMCLGRRVAEQELYLALIKLMQYYRIEYHHPEPIGQTIQVVNRPDKPLRFKFVDL